ncbi:MAG: hypothetical protein Fur0014_03250 [Rubrivivax sp.]
MFACGVARPALPGVNSLLAGLQQRPEVERVRGVALELERVAMHLVALTGLATAIAFLQGGTTYGRLRTAIVNASQRVCGNRFGRGWLRPGSDGPGPGGAGSARQRCTRGRTLGPAGAAVCRPPHRDAHRKHRRRLGADAAAAHARDRGIAALVGQGDWTPALDLSGQTLERFGPLYPTKTRQYLPQQSTDGRSSHSNTPKGQPQRSKTSSRR